MQQHKETRNGCYTGFLEARTPNNRLAPGAPFHGTLKLYCESSTWGSDQCSTP